MKHAAKRLPVQRPVRRPKLESLEDRLPPGDTLLSFVVGTVLLSPDLGSWDYAPGATERATEGRDVSAGILFGNTAQDLNVALRSSGALLSLNSWQKETQSTGTWLTPGREQAGESLGALAGSLWENPDLLQFALADGSSDRSASVHRNALLQRSLNRADAGRGDYSGGAGAVLSGPDSVTHAGPEGLSTNPYLTVAPGKTGLSLPGRPDVARPRLPLGPLPQVTIINVIPHEFSAESTYQSEPSITVDPLDPSQIVIGTFGGLPGRSGNPYFTSADGGATWSNFAFHNYSHGDTSLDWSASGTAYAALLSSGYDVRRSDNPTVDDPANRFVSIPGSGQFGVDQPWVRVANAGDQDRIYTAFNTTRGNIRYSLDSGATWVTERIDRTNAGLGDAPPIRLAINGDTVYAGFERRFSHVAGDYPGDVVIVRDDQGGGGDPLHRFRDLGDLGTTVATNVVLPGPNGTERPGTTLGHERIRSSTALAVDPGDAGRVFFAYTAVENGGPHVHLAESIDAGMTWADVLQIPDSSALPSLAVTDSGVVGLLYTSFVAGNLETHLIQSNSDFADFADNFLFSFPDNSPVFQGDPYIGDYENIRTVGETFFGVFTASNDMNQAYSPYDVIFQRETDTDPTTGRFLLKNLTGGNVNPSLDPYFFETAALSGGLFNHGMAPSPNGKSLRGA